MNKHKRIKYSLNDIMYVPSSFLQKGKGPKYISVVIEEDNKMHFNSYYSDKTWARIKVAYGTIILKRTWDKKYVFWRYGNKIYSPIHGYPVNNDALNWTAAAAANISI